MQYIKKIAPFLTGFLFVACGSPEPKAAAAFERVKAEKLLSTDSSVADNVRDAAVIRDALVPESPKTALVKVKAAPDEWTQFKTETEKKIRANEDAIKVLKNMPGIKDKLLKKVAVLEQNNHDLRRQLDAYNEAAKLAWENFKATMDHEVNGIGIELKNLIPPQK